MRSTNENIRQLVWKSLLISNHNDFNVLPHSFMVNLVDGLIAKFFVLVSVVIVNGSLVKIKVFNWSNLLFIESHLIFIVWCSHPFLHFSCQVCVSVDKKREMRRLAETWKRNKREEKKRMLSHSLDALYCCGFLCH